MCFSEYLSLGRMDSERGVGGVLLAYFLRIQKKEPSMVAHTSNISAKKGMVEEDLPTSLS